MHAHAHVSIQTISKYVVTNCAFARPHFAHLCPHTSARGPPYATIPYTCATCPSQPRRRGRRRLRQALLCRVRPRLGCADFGPHPVALGVGQRRAVLFRKHGSAVRGLIKLLHFPKVRRVKKNRYTGKGRYTCVCKTPPQRESKARSTNISHKYQSVFK